MLHTIADVIRENSKGLSSAVGSPVTSNQSLVEQATNLLTQDNQNGRRIEKTFVLPTDDQLPKHLRVSFNRFLAEHLLRDGSLLLERCLQQRREYQELSTKWFEARIQVDEMMRLCEITNKEEEQIYHLPSQIEEAENQALSHDKDAVDMTKSTVDRVLSKWDTESIALINYSGASAECQGWGSFRDTRGNPHNLGDKRLADWMYDNAQLTTTVDRKTQKTNLETQATQLANNSLSIADRIDAKTKSANLEKLKADFQRERNDVSRLIALRRSKALTDKDGALNFAEQMTPLLRRFQLDLIAAWQRLSTAALGLFEIYQYPKDFFPQKSNEGVFDFDNLVTWCQFTNTWLASFLDGQQQVTRSFSLKQIIGDEAFNAGLGLAEWRFRLTEQHFSNCSFVRLRSFALQIESGNDRGSWNISITPPTRGVIRQNNGEVNKLEQDQIGTLFLGRVNERIYAVIPEGASPSKLYNASPIGENTLSGEWIVSVTSGSTSGASVNDIRDIDIHLTVALV